MTLPGRTQAVLQAAADLASDLSEAQHEVDADRARGMQARSDVAREREEA